MAEVIGFVAGKGGMGKTALCAEIGSVLQGKVLCVDCDNIWGDLDVHLAVDDQMNLTYADIATGRYPLEKATCYENLTLLSAPKGDEQVEPEAFAALLHQARQKFDYILLDNPLETVTADRYILVTTPIYTAVRAARRMADRLEVQGKTNVRLIVNRVEQRKLTMNMDDIIDQTGLQLIGIVPEGKMAPACHRIAQRIQGNHAAIPRRI